MMKRIAKVSKTKRWPPNAKNLFWSSTILVLLLISFMLFIAFLPIKLASLENMAAKALQNLPFTDKAETKRDKDHTALDHQSFQFLGQIEKSQNKPDNVKQNLQHSPAQKHHSQKTKNLRRKRVSNKLSGKNFEEIQGHIPDMQISLAHHSIEDVATKYGFLLVAVTKFRVLGKIIDERFYKISESELSRYSKRGRSADALQNDWSVRRAISENLKIPISEIQLLFLVPSAVEQRFVEAELEAIEKAGLDLAKVKLVEAFYDANLDILIASIITDDLAKIEVH